MSELPASDVCMLSSSGLAIGVPGREVTQTRLLQELNDRVTKYFSSRQSNRVCGIPVRNFPTGITSLAKMKSQEIPAVVLSWMYALGMDEHFLAADTTAKVQDALTSLYVVWYALKRPSMEKDELPVLQSLLERCVPLTQRVACCQSARSRSLIAGRALSDFKIAFEPAIKSGVSFPKFHTALHYIEFIRLFGMPNMTYSGHWEKAHKFLVKVHYLRTGRRLDNMQENIMRRVALYRSVYLKHRYLLKEKKRLGIVTAFEDRQRRRRASRKRLVPGDVRPNPVSGCSVTVTGSNSFLTG